MKKNKLSAWRSNNSNSPIRIIFAFIKLPLSFWRVLFSIKFCYLYFVLFFVPFFQFIHQLKILPFFFFCTFFLMYIFVIFVPNKTNAKDQLYIPLLSQDFFPVILQVLIKWVGIIFAKYSSYKNLKPKQWLQIRYQNYQ